ncbi:MAG TPA: hypothetical protein VHF26_15145, partial [Trebonia sp.]|nr:hypothetical protein [Trebonia sp.]
RKVTIGDSATPPSGEKTFGYAYSVVKVDTTGGTYTERVDVPRGDARLPLSDAELDEKFRDCVSYSGPGWDADAILGALRRLPQAPSVSGLVPLGE